MTSCNYINQVQTTHGHNDVEQSNITKSLKIAHVNVENLRVLSRKFC